MKKMTKWLAVCAVCVMGSVPAMAAEVPDVTVTPIPIETPAPDPEPPLQSEPAYQTDCVIMNIQRKSHSTLLNREITKIWQRPDMLMISRSQTIMQSYPQARA